MSISALGDGAGPPSSSAAAPQLGEDFPLVCGKCLGDNPYVRMMKAGMGKECKISGRPFTAFRWQAGNHRFKETIVAPEVAREKNCCQACLNDLEYGVPFHVRDHLMDALNEDVAPKSEVSREYHWAAKRQKQMDQVNGVGGGGERGTYETLREHVDELRQFAALDPGPIVRPRRDGPLTPEEQERLRQRKLSELRAPDDPTVTSLYIGSVPPTVSKKDLLPYFLAYGGAEGADDGRAALRLRHLHTRADAETAIRSLTGAAQLVVKGTRLRVMWAKKKAKGAGGGGGGGGGGGSAAAAAAAGRRAQAEGRAAAARRVDGRELPVDQPRRVGRQARCRMSSG